MQAIRSPVPASFAQRSTPAIASAVAVFEVVGDVDDACRAIGFEPPAIGACVLRAVPNVDTLLAIRPNESVLLLTPHGGVQVCRSLAQAMLNAGLTRSDADPAWPEAASDVEARMLTALSTVRGERAIALLLDQPRRWQASDQLPIANCQLPPGRAGASEGDGQWAVGNCSDMPEHIARELSRLLHPPLVVATGPANVGKSSLANALAGRTVARVADRPGVTRDAVAVDLELDGLVVRWLDAPGVDLLEGDGVLAAAQELARRAIGAADLVLWCQDGRVDGGGPGPEAGDLRVATRADLHPGPPPPWAHAAVSATTGQGLPELTALIRQRLVSDAALAHPGAWAFWRPC